MKKIVLTFGLISGALMAIFMFATIPFIDKIERLLKTQWKTQVTFLAWPLDPVATAPGTDTSSRSIHHGILRVAFLIPPIRVNLLIQPSP